MTALTSAQYEFLRSPLNASRVQRANGHSHLAAWDIRRHLIRCFGYGGWDVETLALDVVREVEYPPGAVTYATGGTNTRTVWTVVYRAQVRLIVRTEDGEELAHYDDAAAGDAVNQPSLGDAHDLAAKTALSQALKRCAVNLGDQYGLSLYKSGEPGASVLRTLAAPAEAAEDEVSRPVGGDGKANRPGGSSAGLKRRMFALLRRAGYADRDERIGLYRSVTGREGIEGTDDLTELELAQVCRSVEAGLAEEHREDPA